MKDVFWNDGLEDFLRDASDDLRMPPSDRVWERVRDRMHPAPKWPYAAAALAIFGMGILTGVWIVGDPGTPAPGGTNALAANAPQPPAAAIRYAPLPGPTAARSALLPRPTPATHTRTQPAADKPADPPSHAYRTAIAPTGAYPQGRSLTPGWASTPLLAEAMAEYTPLRTYATPRPKTASQTNRRTQITLRQPLGGPASPTTPSATDRILQQLGRIGRKTSLQLYLAPSVSYRRLVGQATRSGNLAPSGNAIWANFGAPTDVNDAVTHKPGVGLEGGAALVYPIGRALRLKAGLQLNFTNYDIEAYSYSPEIAPLSANSNGSRPAIQTVAYFRNANGFSRTWLRNSHFMASIPLGVEYTIAGNRKVALTLASTIQPTYMLRNEAYLISTNLKNYAEEPTLYRNWNVNAGAEAFLSVNTGSYRWVMGPQVRYQLMSSYKNDYPIAEHLVDFGFKVGIQKTLR
jgi:hypothetical protein